MGDPIKTFPRAYWYCKTVVSYPGSAATGAKMKHQRIILALLLLLVAASPMLVQGAQKALSRPAASTTTQASDNDDDDVRAGANHEANDCDFRLFSTEWDKLHLCGKVQVDDGNIKPSHA